MGSFQGRGTAWWMVVIVVVSVWTSCRPGVGAVNYKVGDPSGWTLRASYNDWLAGKTFKVGDTLEFVYTDTHNVVEVTQALYEACSDGNDSNNKPKEDGDTTYTLTAAGAHYYICSVPGHCEGGMKVAVTAEAASTPSTNATTPSSTPTPTTTTPTSSPPTSTSTNSPPNSSPRPIAYPFFSLILTLSLSLLFIKS